MLLLSCRGIKKSFFDQKVLDGIDLDIKIGDRVGLVGINGSGKSTLARILTGELAADSGQIIKHKGKVNISLLKQVSSYDEKEHQLIFTDDNRNSDSFLKLSGCLGLDQVLYWSPERLNGLSGGEKSKLSLAGIWADRPELLIMDEPTNHLDFQGIDWLIKQLEEYPGAVMIISHDRFFLDKTVKQVMELSNGKIKLYSGNYSYYREQKKREYESQLHQYQENVKKQQKINEQINRLDQWSDKAHNQAAKEAKEAGRKKGGKEFYRVKAKKMDRQVKSKFKRLNKMKEKAEKPVEEPDINFGFVNPKKRGRMLIETQDISKFFPDKTLFKNSSFFIKRGDKVGLWGPNGSGKSTLFKIIMGSDDLDNGEIRVSTSARPGYLEQEAGNELFTGMVLDYSKNYWEGKWNREKFQQLQYLLAEMGFSSEILEKEFNVLSPGEKTRLLISLLILDQPDFLLLDEPTNHMDIYSREELENALLTYQGTIIIASHDRYFVEKVCDRILVFENNQIKEYSDLDSLYNPKKRDDHNDEELMRLKNRRAFILSKLSILKPDNDEYLSLENEYQEIQQEMSKFN